LRVPRPVADVVEVQVLDVDFLAHARSPCSGAWKACGGCARRLPSGLGAGAAGAGVADAGVAAGAGACAGAVAGVAAGAGVDPGAGAAAAGAAASGPALSGATVGAAGVVPATLPSGFRPGVAPASSLCAGSLTLTLNTYGNALMSATGPVARPSLSLSGSRASMIASS